MKRVEKKIETMRRGPRIAPGKVLCDCSHVPLHCQMIKKRKNQKKRNIKSRKIDKRKENF